MHSDEFCSLIEHLTCTVAKDLNAQDRSSLEKVLVNEKSEIGCAQFNELLLLVNKDRVTSVFFERFFGVKTTVGGLRSGVQNFQRLAMLGFGNFVFAYRTLSKLKTADELERKLDRLCVGTSK